MVENGFESRNGLCPFITAQVPVQTNIKSVKNEKIVSITPTPDIVALTFKTNCMGSECQLWYDAGGNSCCSLRRVNKEMALVAGVGANMVNVLRELVKAWTSLTESRKEKSEGVKT